MEDKYIRKVQTSVTNFLYNGDEFLFLKRGSHKKIDPGKLNGIGGRLEKGEDFFTAAIRETKEETGYKVSEENIRFAGLLKLEGGYSEDWIIGLFKIEVPTKEIPMGTHTEDGDFLWIHKDKVLITEHELVNDVSYYFKDLLEDNCLLFMNATIGTGEKVIKFNVKKQYLNGK